MATFTYNPKTGEATIIVAMRETESKTGHAQLSLAEEYATFLGRMPVIALDDADSDDGKRYPMFGTFAIGLEALPDKAPKRRNATASSSDTSESTRIVTDPATGERYAYIDGKLVPVAAPASATTTAMVTRGRGRPRKATTA